MAEPADLVRSPGGLLGVLHRCLGIDPVQRGLPLRGPGDQRDRRVPSSSPTRSRSRSPSSTTRSSDPVSSHPEGRRWARRCCRRHSGSGWPRPVRGSTAFPRRRAGADYSTCPRRASCRTCRRSRAGAPGRRCGSAGIPAAWGSPSWPDWRPASLPADRPEGFADVNLWIDTRDTRNVSRATRFCHRFAAHLTLSRDRKGLSVQVNQRPIARAVADAPMCDHSLISTTDRADPLGLGPRDLPPRRHAQRFRSRDQSPARLRLPGLGPRSAKTSSWASAAISRWARTPASGRRSSSRP